MKYLTLLFAIALTFLVVFVIKKDVKSNDGTDIKTKIESDEIKKCEQYLKKIDSMNLSLRWKLLNCGLWQNKNGEIGFKTNRVICSDGQVIAENYITKFGFNENPPLKDIVDTATFNELGNTYYKDKNHIYHYYAMSDGGSFNRFEKADHQTFQIIGDCYAKDKNYIFDLKGNKIDADYKTFKTTNGLSGCVAKDKNGYFAWGERINPDEIDDDYLRKAILQLDEE